MMKSARIKARCVFILLVLVAVGLQAVWHSVLSGRLGNDHAATILLTLFPGGVAWLLPFAYSMRAGLVKSRGDLSGDADA